VKRTEEDMSNETRLTKRSGDAAEKLQQRPFLTPAVDIYENADELLLVADLPGVAKDGVTIHFDKGQLSIEGQRTAPASGSVLAAEFRALDYRRSFAVPQGIDSDKIAAEMTSGVLRVHLPKAAALRPRQIHVKAV
jgi:HSP20 family protein